MPSYNIEALPESTKSTLDYLGVNEIQNPFLRALELGKGGLSLGLSQMIGVPVDLVNFGINKMGISEEDLIRGGSDDFYNLMGAIGLHSSIKPRGFTERAIHRVAQEIGATAPLLGGFLTLGARAARAGGVMRAGQTPGIAKRIFTDPKVIRPRPYTKDVAKRMEVAERQGRVRKFGRKILEQAGVDPIRATSLETQFAIAAGVGAQTAREWYPGNTYAEIAGQLLGPAALGTIKFFPTKLRMGKQALKYLRENKETVEAFVENEYRDMLVEMHPSFKAAIDENQFLPDGQKNPNFGQILRDQRGAPVPDPVAVKEFSMKHDQLRSVMGDDFMDKIKLGHLIPNDPLYQQIVREIDWKAEDIPKLKALYGDTFAEEIAKQWNKMKEDRGFGKPGMYTSVGKALREKNTRLYSRLRDRIEGVNERLKQIPKKFRETFLPARPVDGEPSVTMAGKEFIGKSGIGKAVRNVASELQAKQMNFNKKVANEMHINRIAIVPSPEDAEEISKIVQAYKSMVNDIAQDGFLAQRNTDFFAAVEELMLENQHFEVLENLLGLVSNARLRTMSGTFKPADPRKMFSFAQMEKRIENAMRNLEDTGQAVVIPPESAPSQRLLKNVNEAFKKAGKRNFEKDANFQRLVEGKSPSGRKIKRDTSKTTNIDEDEFQYKWPLSDKIYSKFDIEGKPNPQKIEDIPQYAPGESLKGVPAKKIASINTTAKENLLISPKENIKDLYKTDKIEYDPRLAAKLKMPYGEDAVTLLDPGGVFSRIVRFLRNQKTQAKKGAIDPPSFYEKAQDQMQFLEQKIQKNAEYLEDQFEGIDFDYSMTVEKDWKNYLKGNDGLRSVLEGIVEDWNLFAKSAIRQAKKDKHLTIDLGPGYGKATLLDQNKKPIKLPEPELIDIKDVGHIRSFIREQGTPYIKNTMEDVASYYPNRSFHSMKKPFYIKVKGIRKPISIEDISTKQRDILGSNLKLKPENAIHEFSTPDFHVVANKNQYGLTRDQNYLNKLEEIEGRSPDEQLFNQNIYSEEYILIPRNKKASEIFKGKQTEDLVKKGVTTQRVGGAQPYKWRQMTEAEFNEQLNWAQEKLETQEWVRYQKQIETSPLMRKEALELKQARAKARKSPVQLGKIKGRQIEVYRQEEGLDLVPEVLEEIDPKKYIDPLPAIPDDIIDTLKESGVDIARDAGAVDRMKAYKEWYFNSYISTWRKDFPVFTKDKSRFGFFKNSDEEVYGMMLKKDADGGVELVSQVEDVFGEEAQGLFDTLILQKLIDDATVPKGSKPSRYTLPEGMVDVPWQMFGSGRSVELGEGNFIPDRVMKFFDEYRNTIKRMGYDPDQMQDFILYSPDGMEALAKMKQIYYQRRKTIAKDKLNQDLKSYFGSDIQPKEYLLKAVQNPPQMQKILRRISGSKLAKEGVQAEFIDHFQHMENARLVGYLDDNKQAMSMIFDEKTLADFQAVIMASEIAAVPMPDVGTIKATISGPGGILNRIEQFTGQSISTIQNQIWVTATRFLPARFMFARSLSALAKRVGKDKADRIFKELFFEKDVMSFLSDYAQVKKPYAELVKGYKLFYLAMFNMGVVSNNDGLSPEAMERMMPRKQYEMLRKLRRDYLREKGGWSNIRREEFRKNMMNNKPKIRTEYQVIPGKPYK